MTQSGKPLAAIHVDLDGARHVYRAHGWAYDRSDDPLFHSGLQNILSFLDQLDLKATFFVIAEDLMDPERLALLRLVVERGHDIASHSRTHPRLTSLPMAQRREEIAGSRDDIASALGIQPQGFRAPGFAVDRPTLELIAEAGYTYDSSLFPTPGLAARLSLSQIPPWPHLPLDGRSLVELPVPFHGILPAPFHPSYSLVLGTWYFQLGLRLWFAKRAPLVLLFHLTDFSDPLPALPAQRVLQRLWTISHLAAATKHRRCAAMVRAVRDRYQIVSTSRLVAAAAGEHSQTPHEKAHK